MNGRELFNDLHKNAFPNQKLSKAFAVEIVEGKKIETVADLCYALSGKDRKVALFSSAILAEIGYINPSLLEREIKEIIKIFSKKRENQLLNNCLDMLIALAPQHHIEIYKATELISEQLVYEDVNITDKLVELLGVLTKYSKENHQEICMVLKIVLSDCPSSYFVSLVGKIMPAIDKTNCIEFRNILLKRKAELNPMDQKKIDTILSNLVFA